jgi:hypothetical protein
VEGLLLNSRMANGVFDDANPLTRDLWAYPDTGRWDPDRNTDELIAALPLYRQHGLRAITVFLQGGSPLGYYRPHAREELVARVRRRHPAATEAEIWAGVPGVESQPWDSSGFDPAGRLRPAFAMRAGRLVRAAAEAGLAVILGLFYFGQDERLRDEAAVGRAVDEVCGWVLDEGLGNVVIEIANECDIPRYEHAILTPPRVHELVERARAHTRRGEHLLVGVSFTRRQLPPPEVCAASDLLLLHGNGLDEPAALAAFVDAARAQARGRNLPVVVNEDDHFDFENLGAAENPGNNFGAALSRGASWGYFDPGPAAGGRIAWGDYAVGFQNPPIAWGLSSERKRAFFACLREVTGGI